MTTDLLRDPIVVGGMMHEFLNESAGIKHKPSKEKKTRRLEESVKLNAKQVKSMIDANKGRKVGDTVLHYDNDKNFSGAILASSVSDAGFVFIKKSSSTVWIREINSIGNEIDEVFVDANDLKKALSKI